MHSRGRHLAVLAAAVASSALAAVAVVPAFAASPYAPPGTPLIAFEKSSVSSPFGTVWTANPDGSGARKLGNGDQPLVSPSGAMVAAATAQGTTLKLFSTTGGATHAFTGPHGAMPLPIAWSPDSRYLAVELDSTATNGVTGAGLAVIDTTHDALRVIAKGVLYGASFAVDRSDRIVFGLSNSQLLSAAVNLHTIAANGTGAARITHDGRSLYPIWGAKGIVFDRQLVRATTGAPAYQLWLMHGTHLQRLTNMKIPLLLDGLVPVSVSADGNRLLAEYGGTDTSNAWTVQLTPLRAREVLINGQPVQGAAISRDGKSLLIDAGAFQTYASAGTVEVVPFASAHPLRKLARGAFPSWNQ